MSKAKNQKKYDLEDRTLAFAKAVRVFIKKLRKSIASIEDSKQLIRSSGSIGANYVEANEALSRKDFVMRIKICRKEAKESQYWLKLLDTHHGDGLKEENDRLQQEAKELTCIFGAILQKTNGKQKGVDSNQQ